MWSSSREWMYKRIDPHTNNLSEEFLLGVHQFMEFATIQDLAISSGGKIPCPCKKCKNSTRLRDAQIVSNHLHSIGFMKDYYVWTEHGEDYDVVGAGTSSHYENADFSSGNQQINYEAGNVYAGMVNDAFHGPTPPFNNYHNEHDQTGNDHVYESPTHDAKRFYDMIDAANTPLYDGCHDGHSKLSLASRFMNIKADHNLSESCMDSWAELFTEYLPQPNHATGSYYETETLMRKLGLPYHTFDVCVDNCMLFWKEDAELYHCRFCGKPRFKATEGRKKIPFSRMWYLPITDRLKRMYQSEKTAASMRWHAEHEAKDGVMSHPSDAAEWKSFNQIHPSFAEEKRNVYLGLCTDGFNPFGMSKNHSLWHVIMTPYNLPSEMCMKSEYLFLTVLNSGPNHPRGILDVFL